MRIRRDEVLLSELIPGEFYPLPGVLRCSAWLRPDIVRGKPYKLPGILIYSAPISGTVKIVIINQVRRCRAVAFSTIVTDCQLYSVTIITEY